MTTVSLPVSLCCGAEEGSISGDIDCQVVTLTCRSDLPFNKNLLFHPDDSKGDDDDDDSKGDDDDGKLVDCSLFVNCDTPN